MENLRNRVDEVVMEEISSRLEKYGVPKELCQQCYNEFRFYTEARAVLLNRVPERDNQETGYYRTYLYEVAKSLDIQIKLPYKSSHN